MRRLCRFIAGRHHILKCAVLQIEDLHHAELMRLWRALEPHSHRLNTMGLPDFFRASRMIE